MSADKERLKKALDSLIFMPHLKDRQSRSSSLLPIDADPSAKGRPWDKGDLFRRLQTFKSSTWFAKPDAISPVECARRGWINSAVDRLTCECCAAVMSCPIAPQLLPADAKAAGDRYARKLSEGHDAACPWKATCCSLSLLQFPLSSRGAVFADFKERFNGITQLSCLPPLDPSCLGQLSQGNEAQLMDLLVHGPRIDNDQSHREPPQLPPGARPAVAAVNTTKSGMAAAVKDLTTQVAVRGESGFSSRARALALCGWEVRTVGTTTSAPTKQEAVSPASGGVPNNLGPESATLCCAVCGAKAGLWTYFPELKPKGVVSSSTPPVPPYGQAKTSMPPSSTTTTTTIVNGGGSGGLLGTSPSGGVAQHRLSRHVAVDITTTIAGGDMASPNAAPSPTEAAPFGRSIPFGGGGGGGTRRDDQIPVFGFAALKAADQERLVHSTTTPGKGVSSSLSSLSYTKRMRDPFWESILSADAGGPDLAKKQKTLNATGEAAADITGSLHGTTPVNGTRLVASLCTAAPSPPPAAVLRQYSCSTVNPLTLHRQHCPWVQSIRVPGTEQETTTITSAAAAGGGRVEGEVHHQQKESAVPTAASLHCGWRWCLKQLAPSGTVLEGSTDGIGQENDTREDWDPATLLKSVLRSLEIRK